jgi:hypothetical protein
MKKTTLLFYLLFLSFTSVFSQTDFQLCIPSDGATSGNARAPHGRFKYQRGIVLIKPSEMAVSGIVNGDLINSIAFNYLIAQNATTDGTLTLYLENTLDITNLKSTTWSTAGMTTVSTGAVTIPNTVGAAIFNFTGGSPFTYTGGGVYVAFDYQNPANPLPTTFASVDCNSTGLAGGFKGAQSDTAIPTTLAASAFRPVILLGKSVACAKPTNLQATALSLNQAILTFSVTSGGTVDFEYGPYGFTQGTGTTTTNIPSVYVLSGLNNSSVYDYYVRKNCGGVYSAWSGPYPFHTLFQPSETTYNTGFEQEDFPYIGWLATPSTTANSWFINYGGTGSALVQEGVASAIAITPSAIAASESLFSRGINLTAGSAVTITFYDRNYVSASTNTASYTLTVGENQTETSQTTTLYTATGLNTTTFTQRTVNFTTPSTGTFYFRFKNTSPLNAAGTHALVIDNFNVSQVLGINEFIDSKFSIFPNPSNGIVSILNSENIQVNGVSITDLNGRIVKQIKYDNVSDIQVTITDLQTGVYMLTINSDKGSITKKVIKL